MATTLREARALMANRVAEATVLRTQLLALLEAAVTVVAEAAATAATRANRELDWQIKK
jgi:hypothetical protein